MHATRDTHDAFYRQTVTFRAMSERFWTRQMPAIDQTSLDRLQARWNALEAARRDREEMGRL